MNGKEKDRETGNLKKERGKKITLPRAGIEPATFRLQYSITAERHIQLDHQGLRGYQPKVIKYYQEFYCEVIFMV